MSACTAGSRLWRRAGRGGAAAAAALVLLLAARGAQAGAEPCGDCLYRGDLSLLFVAPRALGPGWETLGEAPVDPFLDPDLRAAAVRAVQSLHYTREMRGGAEVCSVEIWSFKSPEAARRARAGMERASWRFALHGNLLVMLRGVKLRHGDALRPGLLPACQRLAGLMDARVQELLRRAPGAEPAGGR